MKIFEDLRRKNWFYALLLFVMGALAYLLLVRRLGLYLDDWFLVFDAQTQGSWFMHVVFQEDRPARGYLMEWAFSLLGTHLVWYHLVSYLVRYLGSLAFFLTLGRLWENNGRANFLISLFVLIYPAFWDQIHPLDYLSHVFSHSLALISISFSLLVLQKQKFASRLAWFLLSVVTGWAYLGLIEYHIGMEFLRFFLIFVYLSKGHLVFKQTIGRAIVQYLPYLIIPLGFLIWRTSYFNGLRELDAGVRAATDLEVQLQGLLQTPVYTLFQWIKAMLFSLFNATLAGWILPLYTHLSAGIVRLRDMIWILVAGFMAAASFLFLLFPFKEGPGGGKGKTTEQEWIPQAIWGGLAVVFVGLAPIVIVNRTAMVGEAGRYLLPAAPGAAMLLVAVLSSLSKRWLGIGLTGIFIFLSLTSHWFNTVNHVIQAESLREFWWQVTWRAPQIEPGTTLIASYAQTFTPEEHIIWAPANLIYYPGKQDIVPIQVTLPALIPSDETVIQLMSPGGEIVRNRRGNLTTVSRHQILVLVHSSLTTCVRVLDGEAPEFSPQDPVNIFFFASFSDPDLVIPEGRGKHPPLAIFGSEPEHTWCYFYQKAALARQRGDWSAILDLYAQTIEKGFSPNDRLEWMPFLQAMTAEGQMEELGPFASIMAEVPLIEQETCEILTKTALATRPGDPLIHQFILDNFCR